MTQMWPLNRQTLRWVLLRPGVGRARLAVMSQSLIRSIAGLMVVLLAPFVSAQRAAPLASATPPVLIDDFESISAWTLETVDGVDATIHADSGRRARGLRLDVDFHGHGGAVTLHTDRQFDLPENYELRIAMRGTVTVPLLDLTLIDTTDDNQWRSTMVDVALPRDWATFARRKRQLGVVHGPSGGGDIRRAGALELRLGGLVGSCFSVVPIRVARDTLVEIDTLHAGNDIIMTRVHPALGSDSSVVGTWSYPYRTVATAFVAFTHGGQMLFRLPLRSEAGNWRESSPGHGELWGTGPGRTRSSWTLADSALIVTDAHGMATRYRRQPASD